ncbi:MAG: hypothetical protein GXP52_01790 [Deltaproteobacteria bacterium]|nr:hypothetical protein [Deltaproteobacteria bacterium]
MNRSCRILAVMTIGALLASPGMGRAVVENPDGEMIFGQDTVGDRTPRGGQTNPSQALHSLRDIENLRITSFPGGAVLQGELLSPEDLRRVQEVSRSINGIINLCTMRRDALQVAAKFIRSAMAAIGIKGLDMTVVGKNLFLSGTPSSSDDVARVGKICQAYNLPFIDGTRKGVINPEMITFEVSFTEINRTALKELGVKWPSSFSFRDPSGFRLDRLLPNSAMELTINLFVEQGKARIISKPRLVCRSGEKASFLAGGEIPIPRTDADGNVSVTWKRYGIILEVAPEISADGRINVLVTSEVSTIDQANSVEGIPGILTRKISTSLSLAEGQTVVLSGLVNTDDAIKVRKTPLLGDIPILGELFKSKSFQKRETELVVFLTPQLAGNAGPHGMGGGQAADLSGGSMPSDDERRK